jgi:hypothetical protein
MNFEWDPEKDAANQQKRDIGFQEASTVFGDPLAWTIADPDHSAEGAAVLDYWLFLATTTYHRGTYGPRRPDSDYKRTFCYSFRATDIRARNEEPR